MSNNTQAPGSAYFIKMLSELAERTPMVFGKPGKGLSEHIFQKFDIKNPERCLFIGDVLCQDIGFGNSMGFQTLLVLSGLTTSEKLKECILDYSPTYYADSMADFIIFFEDF